MLRTFGPVLFGATTQFMAVVLLTAAFYVLAQSGFPASQWPSMLCEMSCRSPSLLVRLAYLLTALGIALTGNSIIARATAWLRQASPAPHTDAFSPRAATVQLSIPAIAIVIAELNSSSEIAVAIGQWLERPWIGAILPPALWSMGLAGIGSMIHATFRAVPHWDL